MGIFDTGKPERARVRIPKVDTDKIAVNVIEQATKSLESDLLGVALQALGFVKGGREGWMVDPHGHNGWVAIELVKCRAKELLSKFDLDSCTQLSKEETEKLQASVRKAFEQALENEVRSSYSKVIQKAAAKMVQEEVDAYLLETGAREHVREYIREALGPEIKD